MSPQRKSTLIEDGSVLMRFHGSDELGSRPPLTDRSGRWDRPAEPFEWRSDAGRHVRSTSWTLGSCPMPEVTSDRGGRVERRMVGTTGRVCLVSIRTRPTVPRDPLPEV